MQPYTNAVAILLGVVLVLIGVYDLIAANLWGKKGTVSSVILETARSFPILPLLIGMLLGHLFWPQVSDRQDAGVVHAQPERLDPAVGSGDAPVGTERQPLADL